jgi:hypothetical protein
MAFSFSISRALRVSINPFLFTNILYRLFFVMCTILLSFIKGCFALCFVQYYKSATKTQLYGRRFYYCRQTSF